MSSNKKSKILKLFPFLSLFVFVGISSTKPSINNPLPKTNVKNQLLASNKNVTYVNYGSKTAGWYNTANIKTDTKKDLELGEFTLDYGMYYTNGSGIGDILGYKINDSQNITITCPFVIPQVKDNYFTPGYGDNSLYRDIWVDTEDYCYAEDVWTELDIISDTGAGQPNYVTAPTITGRPKDGGTETLSCTLTPTHRDVSLSHSHKGLQDLKITLPTGKNVFDYNQITVEFTDIKCQGQVYNIQEGTLYKARYENVDSSRQAYTLTINPNTKLTGTKFSKNVAKVSTWYEAAKTSSSIGSFVNKATAETYISQTILNDSFNSNGAYTNGTYFTEKGYFTFSNEHNTYTDYLGHIKDLGTVVKPGEDFPNGYAGAIYLIPIYNTSEETLGSLKHEISSFKAFKQTTSPTEAMEKVITNQLSYLVYERNIFTHKNPANPWITDAAVDPTGNESPCFLDYEFYEGGFTVNNPNNDFKLGINDAASSSINYSLKAKNTDHTVSNVNAFTSFESGFISTGAVGQVRNVFNVGEYTGSAWEKVVVPTGTTNFIGAINGMFATDDLTPKYYMLATGETSNKITFNSADVMYVRITKNDTEVTNLVASQAYTVSDSTLATAGTKVSPEYVINSEGKYQFEVFNRTDTKVTTHLLYISEEAKFSVTLPTVTNTDLKIKYAVPDNVAFSSLKISKGTSASHQTEASYVEEVSTEPSGYTTLTKDDTGVSISKDTKEYHFKNNTKTYHDVFYIELVTSLKTKRYLVYWNYLFADYSLTTNKTGNGTITGNKSTYKEDEETNITITPSTENKIVSIKWNNEEQTVTDPTAAFNLKKTMTADSTLDVTFDGIAYYNLTVATPTNGTITGNKSTYSEFEETNIVITPDANKEIYKIMWGSVEIKDFTPSGYTLKKKLTDPTNLTVTFGDIRPDLQLTIVKTGNGTINGVETKTYKKGTTIDFTVTADSGHYISAIYWNDSPITITDEHSMNVSKTINEATTLSIAFNLITDKRTLTIDCGGGGRCEGNKNSYHNNSKAAINIIPDSGYKIDKVYIDGVEIKNPTNPLEITMDKDKTLKVTFKSTATKSNTGMIIGICCGVGAVVVAVAVILIVRAKKVGSMKK